jgi:hypothetical protein
MRVSNPYRTSESTAPTRDWTVTRLDKIGRVRVEEYFSGAADPNVATNCTPTSGATGATVYSYDANVNYTKQIITMEWKPGHLLLISRVFTVAPLSVAKQNRRHTPIELGSDHAKILNNKGISSSLPFKIAVTGRKRLLNLPGKKAGKSTVKNLIYF